METWRAASGRQAEAAQRRCWRLFGRWLWYLARNEIDERLASQAATWQLQGLRGRAKKLTVRWRSLANSRKVRMRLAAALSPHAEAQRVRDAYHTWCRDARRAAQRRDKHVSEHQKSSPCGGGRA